MKWKPYPSYSESGNDLIGPIPSHWKIHRIKHLASVRLSNVDKLTVSGETAVRLANYMDVYKNDRISSDIEFMDATANDDQIERLTLRAGDVLITKDSETPDDIAVPALVPESLDGVVCGYHLAMLRPDETRLSGGFLHRWIQGEVAKAYFTSHANGMTRYGIGKSDIGDAPILCAPPKEQNAMVTFLDHETSKIENLIAEQFTLIERLKEKRKALISSAVTKGLDPRARVKPSGIEWLGEIPDHWELKKLKHLGEAILGLTYSPDDVVEECEGTLVLRSSNVQNGKIALIDNVYVSTTIPQHLVTRLGDILICSRNGSRALIGKNAVIDFTSEGLTFGAFMTIYRSQFNDFISWVLNSSIFEFQSSAFLTSTINQLTINVLNNFEIPFPPSDERSEIANFIKTETIRIDSLINEAETSIALLQEHRSALITAVVTGKVDVRGETHGD